MIKKIVALVLVAVLILNIIFLALGRSNVYIFWFIIILAALSSWMMKKFIK